MLIPSRFLVHTVTVTPLLGETSTGVKYGTPFELACMAQGQRRKVHNSEGAEVLSTLTVYAALADAARIPAGSRIEWSGDTTTVLAVHAHDDGGLGAPQHTEVVCE